MGSIDLFGFLPFGLLDLIDIVLVAFLLYKLYELVKGTIAIRIFLGVISVYFFWLLVTALQMELMSEIFRQFINVGVIALIIVFQQEIRRFLMAIGNSAFIRNIGVKGGLWKWLGKTESSFILNHQAITEAVFSMAKSKTGALIVIEQQASIQPIIDSGKRINADVSTWLLESLFFKNSPMHDGAVIIRGNKIVSAASMLPMTSKKNVSSHYGMRHKAALGITEEFDSIAITVSEEKGEVSIAFNGSFSRFNNQTEFTDHLLQLLSEE